MDSSLEITGSVARVTTQRTDEKPLVEPYFVKSGDDPLGEIEWVKVEIPELGNGHKVFVEAPKTWSYRSISIAAKHYIDTQDEWSIRKMVERVARTVSEWGLSLGLLTNTEANVLYRELAYLLIHRRAAFNSPVWYNIGIKGKEPLCSACFINSVEDTMESITDLVKLEARIFKKGAGAGVNWSKLRASCEGVGDSVGKASGPVSFMSITDHSASRIKSAGKHRRAARMDLLDDDHPDIETFVACKVKAEKMARTLAASGWSTDMSEQESIHNVVPYQSTNISVRMRDAYLEAAKKKQPWPLKMRSRRGGDPTTIQADVLLDQIAEGIWECGDPGVQFSDTINRWSLIQDIEEIRASNPCGEFVFADNTSCNLASINLVPQGVPVTLEDIRSATRLLILSQDIICERAAYPSETIARRAKEYRPLGLGWSNLGGYIMAHGWPYDSAEARTRAAGITSYLTACAYEQSLDIAKRTTPFVGSDKCSVGIRKVFLAHLSAIVKHREEPETVAAQGVWEKVLERNAKGELPRNAMVTLMAPTGTIGLLMDCDTTGIEPYFALKVTKKLSYGGTLTLVSPLVRVALEKLGYSPEVVEQAQRQIEKDGNVAGIVEDRHLAVFDTSVPCGPDDRSISWQAHVAMLAALQPNVSGAISKTVNMPSDSTREDIREAILMAWEQGVKCLAIYRDGSKAVQPLTVDKKVKATVDEPTLRWGERKRLPQTRQALIHKFDLGGMEFYLHVGLYDDGTVGEIFFTPPKQGSTIDGLIDSWAVGVSCALQSGMSLEALIDKYRSTHFEPSGFCGGKPYTSVADYVFRWLDEKFVNPPPADITPDADDGKWVLRPTQGQRTDGNLCPACGSVRRMVGNKCFVCECGQGGGCGA